MRVLVAIPAYNCAQQITKVLGGFDAELIDQLEKVVVIDNGSTDNTPAVTLAAIKKLGSNKFEVWQNDANYNLGGTHKVAFLAGEKLGCDYVAILHGDDQAKTPELKLLLQAAVANPEAAAILGTRFMPGSKLVGYDWKRIWGNRGLNWIYTLISGRRTRDLGSGLNLFKLSDLADHHYLGFGDTITFNLDLLLDYFRKNSKLIYLPITWTEEDQVSNARNWNVAKTALQKLLLWRFGRLRYSPKPASDYASTPIS